MIANHAQKKPVRGRARGFTLVEVMLVVLVTGVLASLGSQSFHIYLARTRRSEAILTLRAVARAQKAHHTIHGQYAGSFEDLDFTLDSGNQVSASEIAGPYYTYVLSQPDGPDSYYCVATGNIDGDPWLDIFTLRNL